MDARHYPHGELTSRVIGAFYETYNVLGHGFAESVYENALALELEESGLAVERQRCILVHFKDRLVGEFRADMVVEGRVLVEIKAVRCLLPVHDAQLINYLRATHMPIGLLLNFGPKAQVRRRIF